ncbi:MAG: hypothetical protein V3V97_06240, partial [Hyphomicrobiaceae bacterium]
MDKAAGGIIANEDTCIWMKRSGIRIGLDLGRECSSRRLATPHESLGRFFNFQPPPRSRRDHNMQVLSTLPGSR